jgi:transposase
LSGVDGLVQQKEIALQRQTNVSQIGMDCHRNFSTVTARDRQGQIVWRQRLEHADRQGLRTQLRAWPPGTPVVLEGTFGWGWMADELLAANLDPHLASSRKVAAWRDARGLAKSNRTDADLLSELGAEPTRWWEVWLAPPAVRQQREWLRYRMALVRIQTGLKNRMHAVLHRHGIVHEFSALFGVAGRHFLQRLVGAPDEPVPASGRATLHGDLQLLDHVRRQIAQATREFRRQVVQHAGAETLRSLPGISYVLAYTIAAEIGVIERFRTNRQVVSYSLLAPRAAASGEDDGLAPRGRHVGKAGRRTLKWAWIEAAHAAVQSGGAWRKVFDARTNSGRRDRNRGYIAVARRLCVTGAACWRKDVQYSPTPPQRPGSRRAACGSRPGSGQPDTAMVPAAQ